MGQGLERHNVFLLALVHALAHGDGFRQLSSSAGAVAQETSGKADLRRMEDLPAAGGDTGADTDIEAGGAIGVARHLGIQGVDALHDDQLSRLAAQGPAVKYPLALFEIIARQENLLAAEDLPQLLPEERNIHPAGLLQVQLVLPQKHQFLRRQGRKIVVHLQGMGLHAHAVQLPLQKQGSGGLAGAGRSGQQDHGALPGIGGDDLRRLQDLFEIMPPVAFQHGGGVRCQKRGQLVSGHCPVPLFRFVFFCRRPILPETRQLFYYTTRRPAFGIPRLSFCAKR